MNDIIKALKDYFKDKDGVLIAFIFGSFINNRLTDESDVDIAVLFSKAPIFSEISDIMNDLSSIIGKEIDIVVLNESSPIVRMQILRNGILLKKKSDALYSDFFVKTVKEYDDLKRIRKEAEDNILNRRIYA